MEISASLYSHFKPNEHLPPDTLFSSLLTRAFAKQQLHLTGDVPGGLRASYLGLLTLLFASQVPSKFHFREGHIFAEQHRLLFVSLHDYYQV